jgi:hypothetical protein
MAAFTYAGSASMVQKIAIYSKAELPEHMAEIEETYA